MKLYSLEFTKLINLFSSKYITIFTQYTEIYKESKIERDLIIKILFISLRQVMGEIIPLFINKKSLPNDYNIPIEKLIKLQTLQRSLELLKEEERKVEEVISQKCKSEFSILQRIESEKKRLEYEIEQISRYFGLNNNNYKKNDNTKSK